VVGFALVEVGQGASELEGYKGNGAVVHAALHESQMTTIQQQMSPSEFSSNGVTSIISFSKQVVRVI